MTTVDPLQNIRRRIGSKSLRSSRSLSSPSLGKEDEITKEDESEKEQVSSPKPRPIQKLASITSKGDRLIVYCKGLVKEQLDKGNTVKYNNIKRAVIEKFDRATYDMYKDEVRAICRDSTLDREKQIRHRISRSSTMGSKDSETSPTPSDLDKSQSAPALPTAKSSSSSDASESDDRRRSMSTISTRTKSARTLSESMNLMGTSFFLSPVLHIEKSNSHNTNNRNRFLVRTHTKSDHQIHQREIQKLEMGTTRLCRTSRCVLRVGRKMCLVGSLRTTQESTTT